MVIVYVAVLWMGCADQAEVPDTGPPQPDWGPFPPQWKALKLTTVDLYGVACIKGHVFIVGDKGTILRSTDGQGVAWSSVATPSSAGLQDVAVWGSKLAWAVGDQGTVLHSGDSGKTWARQTTHQTVRLESVCFTSAKEGWVVGAGGTVLFTGTGGN